MRKAILALALFLLLGGSLSALSVAHAASNPEVKVESQYLVNQYGFAVINETVTITNNGSSSISVPGVQLGFGNLTSLIKDSSVVGAGFSVSQQASGNQTVFSVSYAGASLSPGNSTTFSLMAPVESVSSSTGPSTNETLWVQTLDRPFVSLPVSTLKLFVQLPLSTEFKKNPSGLSSPPSTGNNTYSHQFDDISLNSPVVQRLSLVASSGEDFHPLVVSYATRTIGVMSNGLPTVQDTVSFRNVGNTPLTTLDVSPLTASSNSVTVEPSAQPPLIVPTVVGLVDDELSLNGSGIALPVEAGQNFTITYDYPLSSQYYSVSGGTVDISVPNTPPIPAFVSSYTVGLSLPPGVKVTEAGPGALSEANPFSTGTAALAYSLSGGWALDSGVPLASLLFVVCLVGLFAARTEAVGEEEEEEEETASDRAASMIKAFEEKTGMINTVFDEVKGADQAESNKAFFDERRRRLDAFRVRAQQRMNDVKQKSPNKRFFDLLNQINETDREVDRASKDLLNLYEQFKTSRMREDVFERLQPNYKKRLDRALNQLSDELNTVQREAKLL